MKRFFSLLAVLLFLLSLAACGKPKEEPANPAVDPRPEVVAPENEISVEVRDGITYLKIHGHEMILVNKQYHLPERYNPGVDATAQAAFDAMQNAALEDGISIWVVSGFRSYELQRDIFQGNADQYGEEEANTFSARPGESEHQTGLAFDIGGEEAAHILEESFATTAEFQWLAEHAVDYGFILRFLKDKTWATGYVYEPWHFRYVGVELAHILKDSGLTVEEYAGLV